MKRKLSGGNAAFLAPMYLFTVVFLIGPFVYMLVLSFLTRAETWGVVNSFTLRNYRRILEPLYFNTFVESVKLAGKRGFSRWYARRRELCAPTRCCFTSLCREAAMSVCSPAVSRPGPKPRLCLFWPPCSFCLRSSSADRGFARPRARWAPG